jgi:serine/threonine protein kinase
MAVDPTGETEGLSPGAPAAPLAAGSQLGKYELERVLGAGGMGVVWAATDPDLERAVAIKLLRVAEGSDTQRTRLLREARAMARLKHPNVLTVYEVGTAAGTDYIAMELVEGGSLADWLKTTPPREEILGALIAAGRGLAAAHEAGIVHRDFKPENVLRDKKGHVFVTDFGLAFGQVEEAGPELVPLKGVAVGSGRPVDSVLDSPLTQTGVLIGTPAYMAPEQYEGKVGPRSDQFSFCVTAWEALVGDRPFSGKTLGELRAAAGRGAGRSNLPARLHQVIARGLSRDPEARWPDMPSLLRALEARPSRRRLWMTAAGFAIVAAAGIATIALRGGHGDGCEPADEVFASAWGPAKRADALKAHPGMTAIAQLTILDDTRRKWIVAYEAACKRPASSARHEQLACLLEVRDEVADATKDPELEMSEVVGIAASVDSCRSQSDTSSQ